MKKELKSAVRGYYDVQQLRIQTGGRIVNNFKAKLGLEPSAKEETIDKEGKKILTTLRSDYKKITDGITKLPTPKKFKGEGIISDYTDLIMISSYIDLVAVEDKMMKDLKYILSFFPIYTEFLKSDVKGCGVSMSAVIISEIDIEKATYPSSLWKLAGLDVAEDGKGRSRRKEHLIDVEYINKDGKPATRKSITFKPFLKTKLVGVLGPSFLRSASPYREHYDNYKNRIEHHVDHKEKTKAHRHNMSIRYMVKRFLVDLHVQWRGIEGLPISDEYAGAKLGIIHKKAA